LGATGQFGGNSVTAVQFVGWRFQIDAPLTVDQVGGHMLGAFDSGGIFAALVSLSSIGAFPTGAPFTAGEVIATTTFEPPVPSEDVRTPLSATLAPGSYALVFGSGLFGATSEGAIVNSFDQDDIPPTTIASFIYWGIADPSEPPLWRTNLASHMHVVIEGHVPLDADFDENGVVEGADLAAWQGGFGGSGPAAHGDGDADGDLDVDGDDFLTWQRQVGEAPSFAATDVVPEPGSAFLMLYGAGALLGRRRGR
jgi:hypothetical protein